MPRAFELRLIGVPMMLMLCTVLAASPAAAHPHVWVTVETEVVYNEAKAVTGFRHKWTFDEGYSRFAVEGRDTNNDGTYDRQELHELAEVNVASLTEFDFFTFPKVAGKLVEREAPKDYWLEYTDGALTLYLTLPLKSPVPADQVKDLVFGVYDPTFYVDFAFAQGTPVRLSAAPAGCAPVVRDPNPDAAQSKAQTLTQADLNANVSSPDLAEAHARLVSIDCGKG